MKTSSLSISILSVFILVGCLPEERFWWSPAGDRAVILHLDDLRIVTADGSLSPVLDEVSQKELLVKSVSWLPDGSGFICQRERSLKSWDEARPLISADELAQIERWMPAVPSMLEAFVKLSNADAKEFEHVIVHMPQESRAPFGIAALRFFQQSPALVEKILSPLPKAADILDDLRNGERFTFHELCLVRLDGLKTTGITTLHTTGPLRRAIWPKVSPKHQAVAFCSIAEHDESASLHVISMDGKTILQVADNVSSAQWAPAGRHLVFTSPFMGEKNEVQTILRREVIQASGELMKPPYETQANGSQRSVEGPDRLPDAIALATTLFPASPAVDVLPDGRVLFAGLPVTLPMVESEAEPSPKLYLASADGKSVTAVPTAPGDLPAELGFFAASPDGARVAIVESGTDAVAVLTLATGHTQIISPAHPNRSCRTKPAWKSATELTFAAWSDEDKITRWMLWSESGGTRTLSSSWPAGVTDEWISESNQSPAK